MAGSARLRYKSQVLGYYLDEIEAIHFAEARKRELEITKLYSRFNNDIARKITKAEGSLQVIQRRRTRAQQKNNNILFDGIRDKKLKANWDQTPQPIVMKLMQSRCMRDKVPKGDYIIRASVMDRLVDNKLYYKFVEYGQRIKQQKIIDTELAERRKNSNFGNLNKQVSNVADGQRPDIDINDDPNDEEHRNYI